MMASAMFRFVAAVCRTMIVAFTGGSLALLIVFMLGGFIIPRPAIKPWWIWGYWISPLAYAENAISINEMLSSDWKKVWTRSSMICNLNTPKEVQLGLRIRMNRNGRAKYLFVNAVFCHWMMLVATWSYSWSGLILNVKCLLNHILLSDVIKDTSIGTTSNKFQISCSPCKTATILWDNNFW